MLKANLTLRYTLYSSQEEVDIFKISEKLPIQNRVELYALGTEIGNCRKYISKEHTINYVYKYVDISSVKAVCQDFHQLWSPYRQIVKELDVNGVKSFLLFEFVVGNFDYPELCYENSFLSLLSEMGAELQFFFYEAP